MRVHGPGCQPACKPGSVGHEGQKPPHVTAIPLGRPLRAASSNQPGRRPGDRLSRAWLAPGYRLCRPYSILLPVGLAMPPTLPPPRCALTAPFHPCPARERAGRFAFCGAIPGVTPAGRYPAPCLRGARTFLRMKHATGRPAGWPARHRLSRAGRQCGPGRGCVRRGRAGPPGRRTRRCADSGRPRPGRRSPSWDCRTVSRPAGLPPR